MVKLEHFGIRGQTRRWIKKFLEGRSQRVVVEGESSDTASVTSGVPHGSVLGPILFLIFINDISSNIRSQLHLFADCLIYRMIESAEDRHILQQDLDQLSSWADTWQMTFNVKKCYLMHVTSSRRKPSQHAYYMKGQELSNVDQNPYLGVILSHDMKWTRHIDHITARGNRMLGFLRRNLR